MKTFSYENNITKGMSESRESKNRVYVRDWIVISGSIINTTRGGGYEFFGPFTEAEAVEVRDELKTEGNNNDHQIACIQLIKLPNMLGEHWNPRHKPQYRDELLEE